MPNLFVGRLTRESCSASFESGIEADAIVDYLRRNAHPQALKIRAKAPVVPETIGDGIRLWEAESKRMQVCIVSIYPSIYLWSVKLNSLQMCWVKSACFFLSFFFIMYTKNTHE